MPEKQNRIVGEEHLFPVESLARNEYFLVPIEPQQPRLGLRAGDTCPRCGSAKMDYDGLLNLTCDHCHFTEAGCFT